MVTYAPIDPQDPDSLRAWWEVAHAADIHDRPYDLFTPWEQTARALPVDTPDFGVLLLGAYDGTRLVGCGMLGLPLVDDLTLAYVDAYVHPDRRREGTGRGLFERLRFLAGKAGRRTVHVDVRAPLDHDSPGSEFARALGLVAGNTETLKLVDLAEAAPGWSAVEQPVPAAYEVRVWGVPIPDDHVDGVAAFYRGFMRMVPVGDLEFEDAQWDRERIRRNEHRSQEIGRHRLQAVALAAGEVVAVSELGWSADAPERATVGITGVLAEHRGHGLGLALKIASHRALMEAEPRCRIVTTSNADVNTAMNAVNERLGYRAVERLLEHQAPVS